MSHAKVRWWQLIFSGWVEPDKDKGKMLEEILDSVTFLRAKSLADIEALRAQVNGEDMWFTCHQQKHADSAGRDQTS